MPFGSVITTDGLLSDSVRGAVIIPLSSAFSARLKGSAYNNCRDPSKTGEADSLQAELANQKSSAAREREWGDAPLLKAR